jgi:general secretion pathway protein N
MFAVCVALGNAVQDEIRREATMIPVSSKASTPGQAVTVPKSPTPDSSPISAFSETLARPLFHASRRPPPPVVAATPKAPAAEQPDLTLVGVVIGPEVRSALIRLPSAPELAEVLVGEGIDGWRLDSIETDRIVLKSGDASATYRIDGDNR